MASAEDPLVVALQGSQLYQALALRDPLHPRTWTVTRRIASEHALADPRESVTFFEDVTASTGAPLDRVFISVRQDADGRHFFVSLAAAAEALRGGGAEPLPEVPEAEVKALRERCDLTLWYATAASQVVAAAPAAPAPKLVDDPALSDAVLCPRKSMWATNYSLIPDLAMGPTQRLILCDENTLCREMPEERIFEHLTLIVNCHETQAARSKYRIGACGTSRPPEVIYQAVHQWFSLGVAGMNRANDAIQEGIWKHIQHGTVAVHCLAGIHRAACIVACHFLWRYYVLGHQDVPRDPNEIYRRLKAVRPAVQPAYQHVLQNYAQHLQRRCRS